jgi:hypothetical protein
MMNAVAGYLVMFLVMSVHCLLELFVEGELEFFQAGEAISEDLKIGMIVVTMFAVVFCLVLIVLSCKLLSFHWWLSRNKLTTYEYILIPRAKLGLTPSGAIPQPESKNKVLPIENTIPIPCEVRLPSENLETKDTGGSTGRDIQNTTNRLNTLTNEPAWDPSSSNIHPTATHRQNLPFIPKPDKIIEKNQILTENRGSLQVNFAQKSVFLVAGRRPAEISVFSQQSQIADDGSEKRQFVLHNVVSGKDKKPKQVEVDQVQREFIETNDNYPDQDDEEGPRSEFSRVENGESVSVSVSHSVSVSDSQGQEKDQISEAQYGEQINYRPEAGMNFGNSSCPGELEMQDESNSQDSYHEGEDIFF